MENVVSISACPILSMWVVTDGRRAQSQRPSQQGSNRPSESSAVAEIPPENSVCQPSPDRESSCVSLWKVSPALNSALAFCSVCVTEPDRLSSPSPHSDWCPPIFANTSEGGGAENFTQTETPNWTHRQLIELSVVCSHKHQVMNTFELRMGHWTPAVFLGSCWAGWTVSYAVHFSWLWKEPTVTYVLKNPQWVSIMYVFFWVHKRGVFGEF